MITESHINVTLGLVRQYGAANGTIVLNYPLASTIIILTYE